MLKAIDLQMYRNGGSTLNRGLFDFVLKFVWIDDEIELVLV